MDGLAGALFVDHAADGPDTPEAQHGVRRLAVLVHPGAGLGHLHDAVHEAQGPGHPGLTQAEALEAEATADLELSRVETEAESARARLAAAEAQVQAAERRASLALETRGFFDKSFRLGETDLPTRLRIEAEAAEADRQAARARIDLAAAISAWRQALGLLPQ